MMRLAGGMDRFFLYRFAGSIIGYHFQFARFIRNIHPHQAVATLQGKRVLTLQGFTLSGCKFTLLAVALTIDKKLCAGIVGINENGSILSFPARPCPMRKDMQRIHILVPNAAIQVITVFRQTCQVYDTEYGAMAGPGIRIVWRRFTQIVETSPDKLPDSPVIIISQGKVHIGDIRPIATLYVISRTLMVVIPHTGTLLHRKFIDAA